MTVVTWGAIVKVHEGDSFSVNSLNEIKTIYTKNPEVK